MPAPSVVPRRLQRVTLAVRDHELPALVEGEREPGLWTLVLLVPASGLGGTPCPACLKFAGERGLHELHGTLAANDGQGRVLFAVRAGKVEQRRELVRVDVMLPVVLRWQTTIGVRTLRTTTLDLSGGGALMVGPAGMKPGQPLTVCLALGDGGPDLLLRAEVVRVVERTRLALRFTDISDRQRERIIRFTLRYQREQIRRRREVISGG